MTSTENKEQTEKTPNVDNSVQLDELPVEKEESEKSEIDKELINSTNESSKILNKENKELLLKTPFIQGAILQIIYKNAIKSIPNDAKFRLQFLQEYEINSSDSIDLQNNIQFIYDSIANDFPNNIDCLLLLARKQLTNDTPHTLEQNTNACSVFDNAIEKQPNSINIYESYLQFCYDQLLSSTDSKIVCFLHH